MSDLTDRQAAIDALVEILDRPNHAEFLYGDEICGALGSLPSAQPTQNERVNSNNPLDCISRQAAIDALADYIHNVDKVMGTGHLTADDCKDAAASVFEELPSAQPEIIRCKDCKFFVSDMEWCEADDEHPASPDAFCSWAERRDG